MKDSTKSISAGSSKNEGMMTSDEAEKYLGLGRGTLAVWRHYGKGPRYARFEKRSVRYRKVWLDEYTDSCVVETHNERRV